MEYPFKSAAFSNIEKLFWCNFEIKKTKIQTLLIIFFLIAKKPCRVPTYVPKL